MKQNQIVLTAGERQELEKYANTGAHSAKLIKRARIILALDTSGGKKAQKQEEIAARVGTSRQAVNDVRADFQSALSVSEFLKRKKRITPPVKPKVTGELEAHIIALACSEAPQGHARWTLQLLADKCVELQYVDTLSHMTVKRLLKKRNLSLT